MKNWLLILTILLLTTPALARHIAGGELFYEYLGPGAPAANGNPTSNYKITLRLFRDCSSSGPLLENEQVTVGIYANNSLVNSIPLPRILPISTIELNTSVFPCLVGNISVCYQIGIYSSQTTLEDNTVGYTLSRIGCCRVDRISNLGGQTSVGSNYITKIPGTATLPSGHNSSPQFFIKDTALVCANKPFILDFGASDPDNDELTFSLCEAYNSGSGSNAASPAPTLNLIPLPYSFPYSGNSPLGARVNINAVTGIISGIAPPEGSYVVNVCITESRNGRPFTEHRKDFILKVQNCDFIEADLPDKIIQCSEFKVHFENGSASSAITSYLWDFGTAAHDGSTDPMVDFVYKDTGRYYASLTVTGPKGCIGSDSTLVLVYPGFKPGFTISGNCYQNPFQFKDATTTSYGTIDSWLWDFGDQTSSKDTSSKQNPAYTYPAAATNTVNLIVTNTKGCIDSLKKDLIIPEKPALDLPFKDTLICSIDTLSIRINNTGIFSWLPNKNIVLANTANPKFFPKTTTQYFVTVLDKGCTNTDSVTIRVLDFIKVNAGNDTTICAGDILTLQPVSEALSYVWSSSTGVQIDNIKFPQVQPLVNTRYYVTANLGKCQDHDTLFIKTAPYPIADAGPDAIICFGNKLQINAKIKGSFFEWTPSNSLSNPAILNPIAIPTKNTTYLLKVADTVGCPKTVTDSLQVLVSPPIIANAGKDTAILVNQPLQLQASGGISYIWSPEIGLSDPTIANPIVTLDDRYDQITYQLRAFGIGGCYADDAITIKVFKTGPEIFVPSAITPNGDGMNDILKPVTVGIAKLKYFSVYNRWGQLLYSTVELGRGWDGNVGKVPQPGSTYVYMTEGIDYLGKIVFRKGTTVLIR